MRQLVELLDRTRSAALAVCFNLHVLIAAATLIGSAFGVTDVAWAQGQPITFSAVGDAPYSESEKPEFQQHMDDHDRYSASEFLVHLGDIMPHTTCNEYWYSEMRGYLLSLSVPAFLVPGDNEWNDCDDPTQAWAYWVNHLMALEQYFCGVGTVERQAVRPENFAFVRSGVLFIGINMVHGGLGSQEEDTRRQQDADWVTFHMQTKGSLVRAAVIFAQASPSDPFESQFRTSAVAFGKPVLYIHGDGHTWTYDNPYLESNITRIEVDRGSIEHPPVHITVTMNPTTFVYNRDPWPAGTAPLNRPPCVNAGPDVQAALATGTVLNGMAIDDADPGSSSLTVNWTQVNGPGIVSFGNAGALTTSAQFSAAGVYQLRLTASDGLLSSNDIVSIAVEVALNAPPYIDIIGPPSGSNYNFGNPVTFMGWSFDIENGDLTDTMTWTSDRDGPLGVGGQISTSTLSAGLHVITASATDSAGATSTQLIVVNIVSPPVGLTTVEQRVATGSDDAEESSTGSVSLTSGDLELVTDATNQTVGLRFTGVAVPQWSTILNAWIQFHADGTNSTPASLTIRGQAADSPTTFTTATANISSRPGTSTSVSWSPSAWTNGDAGPAQRTPNLAAIVQDLVTRSGWSSGNSMAFIITGTGTRRATSYNGLPSDAPLLHIEFDPQIPPVVNAGPNLVINLPNAATLDATVTDDGLPNPPGAVTTTWSQLSGPGTATFANPNAIDTTASFSNTGTYVLRLTANDGGMFIRSDDVTVTVTLAGEIDVTPTAADYGVVVAGTLSAPQIFTITNPGVGDLIVGAATLTGPDAGSFAFVSGQTGATVLSGASHLIEVRFSPLTGGPKLAYLSIPSNDPNENPTIVKLVGVASVNTTPTFMEVRTGGSSASTVTTSVALTGVTGHLYLAAISTTPYVTVNTVTGLGLTWTPLTAQCGGRSATGTELWWAQGTATTGLVTATLAFAPTNAVIAVARYSGVADTNPVTLLAAGNTNFDGACVGGIDSAVYSFDVTTTVDPAVVFGAVARLNGAHTPGSGYTERVEATRGSGTTMTGVALVDRVVPVATTLPLNGALSLAADWAVIGAELRHGNTLPMPDIDITPTGHDYGVLTVGGSATRTFTVRNLGNANLHVTASELIGAQASEFAITLGGAPFTIAPGATQNLNVLFTPSLGVKTATLRLTSTDPDEPTVDAVLAGTGIAPVPNIGVTPTSHNFGSWRVGQVVTTTFTVSNSGNTDLIVGAPSLVGLGLAAFTVTSGQAGFVIPPGGSNTVEVQFLPLWGGAMSATLVIPSNDPGDTALFVPLTATAIVTTVPTFEEVRQGTSSAINVTTAASLTGISGHLYLAAVSTRPYVAVNTVTGLGLTWTRVAAQCTGQNQSGIELWWARGNASTGTVTAGLAAPPTNAVIAAARYSGVAATNPIQSLVAGNTTGTAGINATCGSGIDNLAYSFGVTSTVNETMVVGAVARLDRLHTPGAGYTERVDFGQGSGLAAAGLAFVDRFVPAIAPLTLNGTLSAATDWALIGIELRPSTSAPIPNINVVPNPHHDYGLVPVTTAATQTFAISNPGATNLQISSVSFVGGQASQFTVALGGPPFTVLPGMTHNLDVRFAPASVGLKTTTLRLKTPNAYEQPFELTLNGTGLEASDIDVLPATHNFGVVWFGQTPSQSFAIRNVGNLNLEVTSATLIGAQATEFAITLGPAPFTVIPGGTHSLDISYAPTLVGPNTTTLRLTTNDPNEATVDVILNGTGIAPPDVDITPTPYDFGSVLVGTPEVTVGTTRTQTFVVTNLGGADLQVSGTSPVDGQAAEFSVTLGGAPFTLPAGATRNLDVRFAPTSGGPKATTLRLTSNDPDETLLDVALTGTGRTEPEIDVVPATHNYGVIWVNANASRTFTIRNVGTADLNVTASSLVSGQFGEFSITSGGAPFTVLPGTTHTLTVQFAPTSSGPKTTTLQLMSNDVDEPTFTVALTATGIMPPDVDITPTPYDFGSVLVGTPEVTVGTTATRTFVIRNLGEVDLQVTASSLVGGQAGEFAITVGGAPFTLLPGATRNLDVRFAPTSGGPKATTLRLTSNDPDETLLDVALTGTGRTEPEIDVVPPTHNYGVIWVNANSSRTFTIRNVGTADLNVSGSTLVSGQFAEFAITSGSAPFTVVAGATHSLTVQFAPTSSGPKTTTLQLTTNDTDEPTFNVALTATGIMPPDVDVAPTPYNFGVVLVGTPEVTVGTTATRTFAITNLGEADLQVTASSLIGGQAGEFAITAGGAPFTVAGGGTRNLDVRFAPTSGGPKTTTLRLTNNDPDEAPVDVVLSGTGTTAPEIDATPNPHNYGLVVLGVPATRTFAIRNVGSADLHVTSTSLVGGQFDEFAIVSGGGAFTLAPFATHNLNVRFDPLTIGPKATTLRLTSDDQDEAILDVALSGTGKILIPDIHVTPASHDYGLHSIGTSVTQAFTISNTGDGDVVVGTSSLSGPDEGAFAFVSGKDGFTIVPGGSNVIEVRFNAPTEGPKTATLTIPSNDPDEDPVTIQLTGTGGPITLPVFMEMRQGGSSSSVNVTTSAALTGVNGDLYLAAISTRPTRTVNTVTGLGLTWTRVAAQCGGRNLTGVELWWAQGAATTGAVGATLATAPTSAVIAVTRYSGVDPTSPVAPLVRGNTNGVNGACSGGADTAGYSFNVTTTSIQSLVVGAVAIRHRTHTPGAGYTERAEVGQGSTTSRAGLALVEQAVPAPTSLALNGTLSNTADWAVIGVQVRPNTGAPIADIDIDPNPEHDYGDVFVGASASKTFVIRNFGGANLQVSAATLVGGQAGEFAVTSGGAPFTVAPGATHDIELQFAPTSGGPKSTTLQLTTDDPDEASSDVALSGNALVEPEIDVLPAGHNFGVIWVGQNASRTFAVRNIGSADLQVTASSLVGTDAGQFGITSGGSAFTVAPGATHNVDVRFDPTSAGPKTAALRLVSNDDNEATFDVALSGSGIMPPDIAVTPSPHNYGDVVISTNTSRTFVVTNLGGADLEVTASTLVNGQAAEFAIMSGGAPFTLAAGATRNLEVRFAPTTAGAKATTLRLASNDPDEAPLDVALSGMGTTAPELDVAPTSHNYGVIWVGANGSRTFAVRNIGSADLQVTATSLVGAHPAEFGITLGGGTFTVVPGATHNLDVRFAPTSGGPKTATLRLTTNDQDEATFDVVLNGTGIMPPEIDVAPSPYDYGDVLVGTTATRTFVMTNLGEADLQVTGTSLVGGDAGQFAITLGGGAFTLAAGATRNLDIRFAPTSGGSKATSLRLASNDPDENPMDVAVSGMATTAPEIQLDTNAHDYGLVIVATGTATRTFIVGNVGSADLHVVSSDLIGGQMSEFEITSGGAPFTVAPGATHNLVVRFAPASIGPKSTTLRLTSDDDDESSVSIALSGTGTILIPDIAVTPASHNYGTQPAGTGVIQSFTFSNTGDGDVVVGPLSLTGPNAGAFTIMTGQDGFTIAPGASQTVDVRFAPASEGVRNATLTIPSNDPDENPLLVPLSGVGGPAAPPTFEEVQQGGAANSASVTTAGSVLGVPGHLYLAAVGTRPHGTPSTVSGLGLTWTRVANQCAGRSQVGFDLWWAQGAATTGTVTATLPSAPNTASIAVARYSGVAPSNPVALLVSANTNGVNGACTNGTDTAAYSFNVTTTQTNSVVLGVVGLRNRTHTPGSGYTEQAELLQGSGGDAVTIVFTDRTVPTVTSLPLNGTLSGTQDWALIGVELRYGTTVPMSDIDGVPASHAYGSVTIGANGSRTFAIRNVGNDDLDVSDATLTGGDAGQFAITQGGAPFTVAPGGTHNLDVQFSPTSTGPKATTLRLTSDDPDESPLDVALSGAGITPPEIDVSPSSQSYGNVLVGTNATETFAIRNLGGADLQVTSTTLVGAQAAEFAITSGGGSFTVAPGATHNLNVRFAPTSEGLKNATLRLTSADADESSIDVALSGTGTTAPEIDVVPTAHDYGATWTGVTSSRTFAIRNLGNANLQVTGATLAGGQAGEFAITLGGAPFTVAPGATHNLDVQFAPSSIGPKNTTLQLTSDDQDENPVNVALSGTGVAPPDVDVSPNPHNYGSVLVGTSVVKTFVVTNTGGADLQVTTATLVGGQAGEFAITAGGAPFTLASGASRNLDVRFAPTSGGPKATTLRLTSNDPDENPMDVALAGTATTAPEIDVIPTTHNYGLVVTNTTASRTFAVRNMGSADLQVSSASLIGGEAAEFAITSGGAPFTVAPGATHDIVVGFTPTSTGPKATTLRLTSDDQDEPTIDVALSGTGTVLVPDISVTPTSHNYGTQGVGTSVTQSFTISNTGTGDLNVGASTLTGPDASEFAFVSGQAGFTIAPGAINTIQVRFSPTTQVAKSATLTIPSNDPDENPVTVDLTGTGGPATPPTFVDVREGGSANLTTVSTATAVTGVTGHLYLAAISAKTHRQVTAVSGLGLTWTRVAAQCAGRNQTGLELWWAQGTATTGIVTATLASAPANALIAVARYSGVSATDPVAPLVAGNTNGINGACANGTDSAAYSFDVTTNQANALVFGVVAMRTRTNTPGTGYTERAELTQSTGANMVSIAFVDRAVPTATSLPLNGTLSGAVDWAVVGVQLRP